MTLAQNIQATAELTGTRLSEIAATVLAEELSTYPAGQVAKALSRCRRELRGRLTLGEIVARLDDGRPGADEAWAMLPWDEETTAVITEEMSEAMAIARPAYVSGDRVGARLAFRDAYQRLVTEAREARRPVQWTPSLGWDRQGRAAAIKEALDRGRLTPAQAGRLLPGSALDGEDWPLAIGRGRGELVRLGGVLPPLPGLPRPPEEH